MKYITSVVEANGDVKHVVESSGKNVFVVKKQDAVSYGNKAGQRVFFANGLHVSEDLMVRDKTSDFIHVAQIVLAIELTRFVIESIGDNHE